MLFPFMPTQALLAVVNFFTILTSVLVNTTTTVLMTLVVSFKIKHNMTLVTMPFLKTCYN